MRTIMRIDGGIIMALAGLIIIVAAAITGAAPAKEHLHRYRAHYAHGGYVRKDLVGNKLDSGFSEIITEPFAGWKPGDRIIHDDYSMVIDELLDDIQ